MITNNKCAAITISHNESFFLPIWLKYHYKFFNTKDVYVIDHISDDGSTDNLDCNVIMWDFQETYAVHTLVQKVKEECSKLLEKYEYVLFSETDELLIPDPLILGELDEFIIAANLSTYRAFGLEVIHKIEEEQPIDLTLPLLAQRKYCFHSTGYDKTLLISRLVDWSMGFHEVEDNKGAEPYKDLYLFHLKRLDFGTLYNKNLGNAKSNINQAAFKAGHGGQNWVTDKEQFKKMFYQDINIISIPEQFKDSI